MILLIKMLSDNASRPPCIQGRGAGACEHTAFCDYFLSHISEFRLKLSITWQRTHYLHLSTVYYDLLMCLKALLCSHYVHYQPLVLKAQPFQIVQEKFFKSRFQENNAFPQLLHENIWTDMMLTRTIKPRTTDHWDAGGPARRQYRSFVFQARDEVLWGEHDSPWVGDPRWGLRVSRPLGQSSLYSRLPRAVCRGQSWADSWGFSSVLYLISVPPWFSYSMTRCFQWVTYGHTHLSKQETFLKLIL